MKRSDFIGECIMEMMRYNVTIQFQKLSETNFLSYFETDSHDENPVFSVAYTSENYLQNSFESFVHEYCHFSQWKNRSKIWQNARNFDIDDICSNKKTKISIELIRLVQNVERDCDKRVLKLIDQKELPIYKPNYIQKTNSYLLLYNYMSEFPSLKMDGTYAEKKVYSHLPNNKIFTMKDLEKDYPSHRESFFKNYK